MDRSLRAGTARSSLAAVLRRIRTPCLSALLLLAPLLAAPPPASPRPWPEYRAILWIGDSVWKRPDKFPLFLDRLREMGIDTGMVHGTGGDPGPWLEHRFPFYAENLVNRGLCLKWNSPVTDWDRFITGWTQSGRPESAFVRPYSLDDPAWLDWASNQMRQGARRFGPHGPLAYNIRDELSVTVSANPFDFDFSPAALEGFRAWLRTQYPGDTDTAALARLNGHWNTEFASWDAVRPFSTDQVKHRMATGEALPRGRPDWQALQRLRFDPATARAEPTRWNFAPWADFRTYLDLSLARTLDDLRRAARAVDPATPVGIEGTQMPSAWGGYDLWRLAQVLDWIEPYDIGNAREILGSFMPDRPILTTVFETDTNAARRRLWHLLLEGDRGCIIWWSEDCIDWNSPDYALTPKARALAPVLHELKSPLARLFLRAQRIRDPLAIHYSQPSIQTAWLLESTVDGSTWPRRFSSFEAAHNRHAKVRNAWLKALQDLGFSPRFLAAPDLERLPSGPSDPSVLILPRSLAMSDAELAALEALFDRPATSAPPGRLLIADGLPGLFDEHARLRTSNRLDRFFPPATGDRVTAWRGGSEATAPLSRDTVAFPAQRLATAPDPQLWRWLADLVGQGPVRLPPDARTRVHRFRAGEVELVAIERNLEYQMSEDLRQAGGNEALETPLRLTARLSPAAPPVTIRDLRTGRDLGQGREWTFDLDPWQPSLFALLPRPHASPDLVAELLAALDAPVEVKR